MKSLFISITLLFSLLSQAQTYNYVKMSSVNYIYSDNTGLTNALIYFTNKWSNQKKKELEIQKSLAQLSIVKENYKNATSYPKIIIDGWHSVMATDNFNFCKPVKVKTENNKIIQIVLDNYIEYSPDFTIISQIEKGKGIVNINDNVVEIYFTDEPKLTSSPLKAGYITVGSDLKRADKIKLYINNQYYGEVPDKWETSNCNDKNAINLKFKPDVYTFKAFGRGSIHWEGTFEIKENECLIINLNKENQKD